MIYVTRKTAFCAAHRYYDDKLTPDENLKLFGKCTNMHGHNYELEVTVSGEVDNDTGMVVNLSELDGITKRRVIQLLDHKNLNEDIDELKETIPTTEMIVSFIWRQLEGNIGRARLVRVRLREDSTLFADYYGGQ